MFSLLMCDIMPPSSTSIPIITQYFLCVMIMSTISVVASVIVISIHFRNSKNYSMPIWVRKYICCYLAWFLLMKRPRHDLSWKGIRRRWSSPKEEANHLNKHQSCSIPLLTNRLETLSNNILNVNEQLSPSKVCQLPKTKDVSSHVCHRSEFELIRSELRLIINHLSTLTRHQKKQEEFDDDSQDWKFVAMVIDRLCLIFFTLSMALFTGLTLLSNPNVFKLK